MCPSRVTYCPLCLQPLSAAECEDCPEDEYPTHRACRVRMQEQEEQMDLEDQQTEYREREPAPPPGPYRPQPEEDESCS